MIKSALWDLDGTLVDSEEFHWLAWRDTMAAEGVSITRQQFMATFGQRNDAIVPRLLGKEVGPEQIQRIGDAKEAGFRSLTREKGISPLPGAGEWVKRLQKDGWLQAIASSAPRLNIEVVLELLGLGECFGAMACAEDVEKGKPDPEVFLLAASRLGAPPSRCIVVEDAAAGTEAARRAGMRSIGLSRTGAPLAGDLVVSSLAALPPEAFNRLLDGSY